MFSTSFLLSIWSGSHSLEIEDPWWKVFTLHSQLARITLVTIRLILHRYTRTSVFPCI